MKQAVVRDAWDMPHEGVKRSCFFSSATMGNSASAYIFNIFHGVVTLDQALASVEHNHRIRPIGNNGSTTRPMNRPMIATIASRPLSNDIIRFAKAKFNRSTTGEGV